MIKLIKKYRIKIILITIIIVFCTVATYLSNPNRKLIKVNIDKNKIYEIKRVLDGDTFEIENNNKTILVRMLGIDTPETIDPRKPIQCFGKEASDKTKELLQGNSITLEIDSTQSNLDKYGRILAYVYRANDNLFINQYLLDQGYAREYTYGLAYKKQKEFKEIQKIAKKDKRGLWEICN